MSIQSYLSNTDLKETQNAMVTQESVAIYKDIIEEESAKIFSRVQFDCLVKEEYCVEGTHEYLEITRITWLIINNVAKSLSSLFHTY